MTTMLTIVALYSSIFKYTSTSSSRVPLSETKLVIINIITTFDEREHLFVYVSEFTSKGHGLAQVTHFEIVAPQYLVCILNMNTTSTICRMTNISLKWE